MDARKKLIDLAERIEISAPRMRQFVRDHTGTTGHGWAARSFAERHERDCIEAAAALRAAMDKHP
jgi:hypothetical protein